MAFLGMIPDDDPNHPLRRPKIFIGPGMRPLRRPKQDADADLKAARDQSDSDKSNQ